MELTPELKAEIDSKTHYELLSRIRFAPVGDPVFQGESGKYWIKRRNELKEADPGQAVADSKALMR
jgi:hypothetical protein